MVLEADLYGAEEAGVLALVVDDDLVSLLVAEVLRLFEVGVRVAAEEDVYTCSAGDEIDVHVGSFAPAEVAETDNDVAVLIVPEMVDDGLCCFGRLRVAHPFEVLCCDESLRLWTYAEDAYAHARAFLYNIWFCKSFARRAGEVVVAAYEGEFCRAHEVCKVLEAEVEFVVADGACVVVHEVHQLDFNFSLIDVVEDRALAEVSAVEQEQVVGVLASHLFEEHDATQVPAFVCLSAVAEVRRYRVDAGVRIAGVDDEERVFGSSPDHL